jgi:PAS domain S-box-containing protein
MQSFFAGPGEMRARCRQFDWSATSLGDAASWPTSLRVVATLTLDAKFATVLLWGPDLIQIYNDAYRSLMGSKHPAGFGQPTRACWPEVWSINEPIYARVMNGESVMLEDALFPIRRADVLEDAYFTLTYGPARDESGDVGGVLVTVFETTTRVAARVAEAERLRLMDALTRERARLEEVFRVTPSFLAVVRGPSHVYEQVNDAYYQLVGRRPLVGRPMLEALPEAVGQGFDVLLDGVLESGIPYVGREVPALLVRTPGEAAEERFLDLTYLALTEADGTRSGVIAHGSDVTEQVRARRQVERLLEESETARTALAVSENQLRIEALDRLTLVATLEQATDFIGIATTDGNAIYVNPAGRAIVGLESAAQAERTTIQDYFPDAWHDRLNTEMLPSLLESGGWRGEVEFRHTQTGEAIPVEWNAFVVGDPETGAPIALACTARDLREEIVRRADRTALLHAADEARANAESANRAKSQFLTTMSHELRSPLTAIGGYAELLSMGIRGPVTPEQIADLARITRSQNHLLGLINGVLDYARIEGGHTRYDIRDVSIDEMLATSEALIAPLAGAKHHTMHYDRTCASRSVRGDGEKVQQIIVNLLSNAVKFTDAGGTIALSCSDSDTSPGDIALRVSDSGRGIAADQFERVFEAFAQVDQKLTRAVEGTGLGLAISRDLARGMGGELSMESIIGQGSTFTLTLPRA